jgi:serine/threonine protein kinase
LKYFGTFFDNGKIGMVMEWYEYNLSEYINILKSDNYQFDIKYYSFMTYKLLNSFKIMADNGILHNDIKPHNMLINDQLSIKIIDFDISLIKIQEENLSRTGYYGIQGTDGYLAPEQKAALNAGQNVANYNREKADVYSLGLVFYQLLTYRNLQNITTEIIEKDIDDHLVYNPDIGEFLKAMLNPDPTNRPNFSQALAMLKNGPTTRSFS